MTTLRLYDNDGNWIDVDVEQSQPVKINREFDKIETLKGSGDYTQDFELPFTDKLANFFGFIPNVNTQGWFNPKKKITSEIISNSIPLIRGFVQILARKVTRNNIRISVRFTGQVPELIKALGEKRMKDISTLDDLNYELVDDSWSDPNANTILTICDRIGFCGVNGEANQPVLDDNYPCYIGQMTPAVKASYLFTRCVQEAGFTFDTDAIDAMLEDVYVPFISERSLITDQRYENVFFNLGLTTDLTGCVTGTTYTPSLTEFADNGTNVASGVFTAPFYGTYTFRIWGTVTRTGTSTNYSLAKLQLLKNGTTYVGSEVIFPFDLTPPFVSPPTQNRTKIVTVTLNAGDTLSLKFLETSGNSTTGSYTYTVLSDANNSSTTGTGWQLESIGNALFGADVFTVMSLNAPDIKQADFVNGIIRMFKLAVVPDNIIYNRLIIQPMVDYIGSGDTIDWTPRMDTSQLIQIETAQEIQPKNFEITYKADGDAGNEYYTKNFNRTFGRYRITNELIEDAEVSDFSVDDQRIELPFGATPCDEIVGTNIITAKFLNTGGDFVLPTCRLVYKSGTANVRTITETFTLVTRSVYTVSNYSDAIPNLGTLDLNFGIEQPLHTIDAQPFQTIWYKYWAKYYREIYSKDTAILTANFNLDTTEVGNLTFSDKIWIENDVIGSGYWRLLNIYDFDPEGSKTTRCRLMKVLNLGIDCEAIPEERLNNGQITFTQGGETTDGNLKCCVKYGYVWNEAQEKCFVRKAITSQTSLTQNFIDINEGRARTVYVSSDYYVQPQDEVINVDSTGGQVKIYLPSGQAILNKTIIVAHHEGSNQVKVYPYDGEKIQDKPDLNVGNKGELLVITANENGYNAK